MTSAAQYRIRFIGASLCGCSIWFLMDGGTVIATGRRPLTIGG